MSETSSPMPPPAALAYAVGSDIGLESCMRCCLEATSRYGENLYHALRWRGYRVCLLHPGQIHAFAQPRGLRAKTDRLDATTLARALLSGEARFGDVPSEEVATYREVVRLQQQLTEEIVR